MIYSIQANKNHKTTYRIISFICSLILIVVSFFYGYIFLIPSLIFAILIFLIKNISLDIYQDKLEINHIGILKALNVNEIFKYEDIKKIKYDKGFTNIKGAILDVNNAYYNRTNSKKDTIEISMKDGTWRIINRIGNKDDFKKAYEIIIQEINNNE